MLDKVVELRVGGKVVPIFLNYTVLWRLERTHELPVVTLSERLILGSVWACTAFVLEARNEARNKGLIEGEGAWGLPDAEAAIMTVGPLKVAKICHDLLSSLCMPSEGSADAGKATGPASTGPSSSSSPPASG